MTSCCDCLQEALGKCKDTYKDTLDWKMHESRAAHAKALADAEHGQQSQIAALTHDLDVLRSQLHKRVRNRGRFAAVQGFFKRLSSSVRCMADCVPCVNEGATHMQSDLCLHSC